MSRHKYTIRLSFLSFDPDYEEAKASYVAKCIRTENSAGQNKSRLTCKREFNKGS